MKLISYATLGLFAILTATFFSGVGCKSSSTTTQADAGIVCVDGEVILPPITCNSPTLDCGGGYCVDPMYDSDNCGGCGKSCGAEAICCGGTCINPGPGNCGFCGGTCGDPTHPNCAVSGRNAVCVDSNGCESWQIFCGGKCVPSIDRGSCGSCDNICPDGKVCMGTTCAECSQGTTFCNGSCAYLDGDPNNCGACGHVCPADQMCAAGACVDIPVDPSASNVPTCP